MTPQVALMHALSHALEQAASSDRARQVDQQGDHHLDKVCGSCLAFAQLGAALPARFQSQSVVHARPRQAATLACQMALPPALAFHARAPPAVLI